MFSNPNSSRTYATPQLVVSNMQTEKPHTIQRFQAAYYS
ncbi:hypothetical protein RintRC_5653 [Richelia intracellularis]|nr:hypothetical protein RintRC_5653 [Richelia intracellularis]